MWLKVWLWRLIIALGDIYFLKKDKTFSTAFSFFITHLTIVPVVTLNRWSCAYISWHFVPVSAMFNHSCIEQILLFLYEMYRMFLRLQYLVEIVIFVVRISLELYDKFHRIIPDLCFGFWATHVSHDLIKILAISSCCLSKNFLFLSTPTVVSLRI